MGFAQDSSMFFGDRITLRPCQGPLLGEHLSLIYASRQCVGSQSCYLLSTIQNTCPFVLEKVHGRVLNPSLGFCSPWLFYLQSPQGS